MSYRIQSNINESPIQRPRADIHDGSLRSRRRKSHTHRSLMQRFIPFAEERQRRERRSSSRASLPLTPPTTPIPAFYPTAVTKTVPVYEEPRQVHEHSATHVLHPEDELDLSSDELYFSSDDEDYIPAASEGSVSSSTRSWKTVDNTVDLSKKTVQIQPPQPSPTQLLEEEPMEISQEDCVTVHPEPMRLGSFQGTVPTNEHIQLVLESQHVVSESSDEEIARVFDCADSDSESLYSWSSSSSNGRVNRPGRHAESVLDRPAFFDYDQHASPYAHLQVPAPVPYSLSPAHVSTRSTYDQLHPQYVHGYQQLGEVRPPMPYVPRHPQVREVRPPLPQAHAQLGMPPTTNYNDLQMPDVNANCVPLDLASRKMSRRPFEAPYHLQNMEMSRFEYQRLQSRSRISQRLTARFTSKQRSPNANEHVARNPCCCHCHAEPKIVPIPVNSYAIDRFLQEAQLSPHASPNHATSYLLIPTHTLAYSS